MNISKREKMLLVAALAAAVLAAFYLLFYQPLMSRVEEVFVIVESEQTQLQDLLAKERQNKRMLEEIARIESDISASIAALPKADDEPGLVKHLHHMFEPFEGKDSVSIEDPVVYPEFSEVRVNLAFESSYQDFNLLLKALENSPYKNRLNSFSVSDVQTGSAVEDRTISVNMSLTFYFSN